MTGEGFETVQPRTPEGLAVYLRGRTSGRMFRVSPARDPAQPRLWCLWIEQCPKKRTPDRTALALIGVQEEPERSVIGVAGLTREEALATLRELGADPEAWLERGGRRALTVWLLEDEAGRLAESLDG